MSTTYAAVLFYGYKLDHKPVEGKVKRYDEVTGKPYFKKLVTHYNLLYNDRVILRTDKDSLGDVFDADLIFIRNIEPDEVVWIGKKLCPLVDIYCKEPHVEVKKFSDPEIDKLEKIFGDKPKIYLMMDVY